MGFDEPSLGRREVLSALAGALGGLAGCATTLGREDDPVSLLAAGSLNNALENGLRPAVGERVRVEARGSAEVVRLVASESKDPDIVSVADTALFEGVFSPDWFAEFATNAIVLAYDPDSDGGRRIAAAGADEWYRPLLDGAVRLGRTDPAVDPLGYRTLFVLELATEYYDVDANLRAEIPDRDQIFPETQLVSQFETGAIDAAVTYRSMAVDRGYEYVDLPAAIDLSDPDLADRYASATYELPNGRVVTGDAIRYGSTARRDAPPVADVFVAQVTGEYLANFGFTVPSNYPRYSGNVPDTITN